jgi:hypothetical protein
MQTAPSQELALIFAFLERIGLPVSLQPIAEPTFMPGLSIRRGVLLIDAEKLLYPGDLLHEAGHLPVMLPAERELCNGDAGADGGAEIAAIVWSYAAALEIGIDPHVVFHANGYKSGGATSIQNFTQGRYIGAPLLQWFQMTNASSAQPAYPRMIRWLRGDPESV